MIPAMEGVAGLFSEDVDMAICHAAAEIQARTAKAATLETDPVEQRKLKAQVMSQLTLQARTSEIQRVALGSRTRGAAAAASGALPPRKSVRKKTATRANTSDAAIAAATSSLTADPSVVNLIGDSSLEIMRGQEPRERSPQVAGFARHKGMTKDRFAQELGTKVSRDEWLQARRHAFWPGPGQPLPKLAVSRQGVSTARLNTMMRWLTKPDILQQYAFGEMEMEVDGGRGRVEENV